MQTHQILAVEDHPIEQKLLGLLAKEYGFVIKVFTSAEEALEELQRNAAYDLILMDWSMPGNSGNGMNGLECATLIRQLEKNSGRHVPIIAVTAHAMLGDRSKCLEAGMDDYLAKPYTPSEFQKKLSTWLNLSTRNTG